MGLQKYRADMAGETQTNGATPFYTVWMGGPSLALIRNCPTPWGARTVYVRGEADTFFSIPAACSVKGHTVRGFITQDDGCYVFAAYTKEVSRMAAIIINGTRDRLRQQSTPPADSLALDTGKQQR